MNYDNLVDLITEEIYKKINSNEIKISNKPKAVIVFEQDNNKFNLLKDEFEIVEFDKSIRECEIVIVSRLCMRGLSNIALGNSTSDEERFILKMIMKGKKVYVLDEGIEYKKYKDTAPKALYKKFMSFEDEICKFGVEIIKDLNVITKNKLNINKLNINKLNIKKELESTRGSKKEDTKVLDKDVLNLTSVESVKIDNEFSLDLRNKKLISEADLRKPTINGVKNILVNKKSIITPLAVDFMRIHHLKLKKV
ncbi:putative ethanolamine utilization protein [Clostridioides difficile 824]|uniref:TIGR02536 family ethanolamine utilization protein n=1 Tax=Clostridioides difficile TaxID=1496 RepID=UPI00038D2DD1|nr:TIGR02536 family ethanolamine utilization protein [Clostridioides difficile]OFU48897.1 ethanolamine utilization protein [Clostridium sp. HMSC19A11]EGT4720742.1 ethanolamine utilization protein [Clostridioides difficile]EQF91291.1 putative ethanolamine utilization protein [Clostridioides difficile 824]EZR28646.1 ethanolamine utilization protein [Clostridioides difficile]MCJ0326722.1 TIGR02536 family ethanolamine utilization protein [Clostridioides difficile]